VISFENYRKTVQHLEGGIVREIKVRDGEVVAKGQILLTMDDTQSRPSSRSCAGSCLRRWRARRGS